MRRLLHMFWVFFQIGLFTIGGGYAMLPIIQKQVVETQKWMNDEEFLDALSLTNSLPGPLATNSATFVGYRVAGVPGAVAAISGAAAPSVLIILVIAAVFQNVVEEPVVQAVFQGVRPAVAALILYSLVKLGRSARVLEHLDWLVSLLSFAAMAFLALHPIVVVVCAALYGLLGRGAVVRALEARKGGRGAE